MSITKVITVGFMVVAASALALDYVEVIDVSARQRYPWNGLVDIDFELDSRATEPYMMKVTVFDNVGKTNLPVKTVYTENVSQKANPCMVTKDTTRIVWDAAADLPDGFKCTNVLVTCQDTRCTPIDKLYCVIDISAGSSASSYPVSYLDSVPAGGWTDEYKTTKMVLRRIEKGSFMMGSVDSEVGRSSNEDRHKVTLTKPFYIGVFEVTEKQWNLVYGESGDSKKAKFATYAKIRGTDMNRNLRKTEYCYPDSPLMIDPNSFLGKLKAKTGLTGFEMPTEAQWEYACKAGCDVGVNIGCDCTPANVNLAGRNKNNANDGKGDASSVGVTYVGCYVPNAWGLYDMLGNAVEWCRDAYTDSLGTSDATDPTGAPATVLTYPPYINVVPPVGNGAQGIKRVVKGGVFQQSTSFAWNYYAGYSMPYTACRPAFRTYLLNGDDGSGMCGFRVVYNTILTGMGRFHDEVEQTFNIQPAGICSLDICSGTRIAHLPEKITYDENWFSSAGAGYVRIMENGARVSQVNGRGEYSWSPSGSGLYTLIHRTYIDGYLQDNVYTATFLVGGGSLTQSGIEVTLSPTSFAYDGTSKKPAVIVTHEGARLTEGLDYSVSYRDNVEIGTGYAVVSGMGDYSDVVERSFLITESPGVYQVMAQQRYPWNGLVDVSFKTVGQQYTVTLSTKDVAGNTNLPMRTVFKQDGTAVNMAGESLVPGTYNWVWDAAADLPDGFECDRVTVTIESNDEFVYSVKFNANGGTGTMENETFTYGTAKLLTPNAFTRVGYLFQGWAMSATGAKLYDDQQSVSNLTETSGVVVNLYAVWTDVHDKVQLWEGGPYWATTNIGANEPWESGYYFWWGDTIGYKREGNAWVASDGSSLNFGFCTENTPTYGKSNATLKTEGWLTEEEFLAPEHDAAQMHWGGGWRLPRRQELDYLVSLCDWTWTTTNNVKGYVVRGRGEYASASIFLPITGLSEGTLLSYGSYGYYWSSDPTIVSSYYNMPYYALYLYLTPPGSSYYSLNGDFHTSISGDRNHGCPLRPVKGISE